MPVRFQVDPDFYDHPKTAGMSDAAFSLWVRAGSYSAAKLTDGFIAESVLVHTLRSGTEVADELVERGLWRRRRGGFTFHEWNDRNLTKQRVESHNKSEAERKRRERQSRKPQARGGNVRPDADRTPNGLQPESDTVGVGVVSSRGYFSGESLETYENDQGKDPPPPKMDPDKPRCPAHAHIPAGQHVPNCGSCADLRKRGEQRSRSDDLDQTMLVRRCPDCDAEGWRVDDRRVPLTPYQRCDHRPLRSVS
jgi:hypothetical protein